MKIIWKRQYTSRNASGVATVKFVYAVSGTPEQLAAYKEHKGEFYREDKDSKEPLYFTERFVGKSCNMIKTEKGSFVPDTTEIDQLANLSNQYGIDVALRVAGVQTEVNPA